MVLDESGFPESRLPPGLILLRPESRVPVESDLGIFILSLTGERE